MFYKTLLLTLVLSVTACGGGGDTTAEIAPAGIYAGTITPTGETPDTAVALILSTGDTALVDIDTLEAFIGTKSGNSFTGTLYASTSVASTAQVTSVSGNNISGTYSSSLGGGTFTLLADTDLYNRTSSLTKLEGTWVDLVFTNNSNVGISTWVIQADGSFEVTTTSVPTCYGSGSFAITNDLKNEYSLSMNIANCQGLDDGAYVGFAALSDTAGTDNTLSLVFSNGSFAGFSQPIK